MTRWTLLPDLVVRSAAFEWALLDGLRCGCAAEAADRVALLEAETAVLLERSRPYGHLPRGQAARLRGLRPLPEDAPVPPEWRAAWNRVTHGLERARLRLAEAVDADGAAVRGHLRALLDDERFLDALVCSSPPAYRDLARAGPQTRRACRQLGSYVQRLAAKCETMSFFGPIDHATVDRRLAAPATLGWRGPASGVRRRAHLAAWAAEGLQRAVLDEPELAAEVVPRRKTFSRPHAGDDADLARLLAAVDGRSTLAAAAARCGLALPAAAAALRRGVERGVLGHDAQPDATEVDPARWLARRLRGRRTAAGERAAAVADLLDQYPGAAPQEKLGSQERLIRLAAPGGAGARPQPGKFYSDRVVVHEAAAGTLALTLSGDLARDLEEAVPPALDLLGRAAARTRERTNRRLAAALGPGRFPLLNVLRRCGDLPVADDPWLADWIARALRGAAADVPELELAEARIAPEPRIDGWPLLCSIDVMVATPRLSAYRRGVTPLVLADVHDTPLLTPWALQFHEDRERVLASRDAAIVDALAGRGAVSVVGRRATGLPSMRLPGLLLELGQCADAAPRVALDRLYVQCDGGRAELRSLDHPGELAFHNGELESGVHTALALPRLRRPALPELAHVPRLCWRNVVLARRRWRLEPQALAACAARSEAERLLAVRRLRAGHRMPERFFARSAHERKPLYVDASSPVLVDALLRLAASARAELELTEVLPDREELWLRDGERRFAAELRCVYLRRGDGRPDG